MLGLDQYLGGLNRYILRQCLSGMIFVTGALTAAVWLAQSLRLVDLIVNRGLSAEVFLYLATLIMPRFFYVVLPIGAFIAVLFVFNRLINESELVVMRAAGLGSERDRVRHPDGLVGLFPAGSEPGIQGPAIRDPQSIRLQPAARGHFH